MILIFRVAGHFCFNLPPPFPPSLPHGVPKISSYDVVVVNNNAWCSFLTFTFHSLSFPVVVNNNDVVVVNNLKEKHVLWVSI